jgi:hypothetical protein
VQEKFPDGQSEAPADHERKTAAPMDCRAQVQCADQLVDQPADHQQRDGNERRIDVDQDRAGNRREGKARETRDQSSKEHRGAEYQCIMTNHFGNLP